MTEKLEGLAYVEREAEEWSRWTRKGQKLWSFANNGSTVIIVTFSAIAAVLAQASFGDDLPLSAANLATALSLTVTIVSTVQSKLGFERKWAANRASQSALQQLMIDVRKPPTDISEVSETLKRIIANHDQQIISAGASPQ
ncbi:MAG: hypothetical protein QOF41_216 [Methylobacteriaceae bacterium]|jgi:ABC-type transport system involved in cytochrome c biogenesis permease component|nr:hypothetical protein [Methylobacteriaceae bacterium]